MNVVSVVSEIPSVREQLLVRQMKLTAPLFVGVRMVTSFLLIWMTLVLPLPMQVANLLLHGMEKKIRLLPPSATLVRKLEPATWKSS